MNNSRIFSCCLKPRSESVKWFPDHSKECRTSVKPKMFLKINDMELPGVQSWMLNCFDIIGNFSLEMSLSI